jgi:pimeloyl-ACP methyl ester carboxylesterase
MTRILYLHGFASSPSSSKAQFFREHLEAAGARVEIPALDGGDFEHLTVTGQLAIIERAARGEPVSLIGSSLGGYLAALYACRHPETARVVMLAPAFDLTRRWAERLAPEALEAWRTTGAMEVFHYGDKCRRKLAYDFFEDGARYPEFPRFSQPALIFHGAQDDVVPAVASREFAAGQSNVRLEVLQSGHDLLDVLDYMAPKVIAFLSASPS